ncbi:hypothetical protein DVU_1637 [Nitratidesulfovibrio vulgaris str. Hildenborough]|uniref:Uncharacterized protein n=1 Tax=Nitratidesulfovibrio vulgaris (strain ATCC 29579 / DSM 644 / CCUG 34227 / NCIMB 8303 / VKM B-1760 / Hildenborough) TaxID=882 RepID=Q72BJ8_NITV2|nr:hypothetical protein DVU_1637 [Nitratidesulfovibrio vulgaris str. Hildenborough]
MNLVTTRASRTRHTSIRRHRRPAYLSALLYPYSRRATAQAGKYSQSAEGSHPLIMYSHTRDGFCHHDHEYMVPEAMRKEETTIRRFKETKCRSPRSCQTGADRHSARIPASLPGVTHQLESRHRQLPRVPKRPRKPTGHGTRTAQ